ncbi:hypothetical protein OPV22_019363 [Ensete ventricosum]|uniref:Uncharacterized protein n=1 Tax=Ensete ventricosum TaxID=4639 RepID=A0AAV8PB31_ENSVE|nr:hypothetical protein OPV22_019363 [Ensete ventricosum]
MKLSLVPSISSTVEMDFTGDTRSYNTIINPHMTRKSFTEKHRPGDPLKPAHEKIGVVDAQWIVNRVIPSIGDQVRERCMLEWSQFQARLARADRAHIDGTARG